MTEKKRGGYREGSGRPVGELGPKRAKRCTVAKMTEDVFIAFGEGNFSEGLERAAKLLLEQKLVEIADN